MQKSASNITRSKIGSPIRLTIGKQILLAFIVILLAFTGLNVYTYFQLQVIEDGYDNIIGRSAPLVFEVKDLDTELSAQSSAVRAYILTGDQKYETEYYESLKHTNITLDSLEKKLITADGRQNFLDIKAALFEYQKVAEGGIKTRKEKGMQASLQYVLDAGDKVQIADKKMTDFVKFMTERMDLRKKQNDDAANSIEQMMVILDVVILTFAIIVALWLSRRISRPLIGVVVSANQIAAGDLQYQHQNYNGNDELGDLIKAFDAMAANLRNLVGQVSRASEQVAASSEELTASAEQSAMAAGQVAETISAVASGAAGQTTAVEQAVATVDEMASAIDHIASTATDASDKSSATTTAAQEGSEAMADATNQMRIINESVTKSAQVVEKLGESSKQIGEIVDVISGIAGQTNLLALNAAIEAARAGEQGRGFAVVAEEVRKLAEQSHEAAQKIAVIVRDVQAETATVVTVMNQGTAEVVRGSDVISATGERFKHIVGLVVSLNGQIQDISSAAEQLSASSTDVVASVASVKQIATETAANTQTISAAAQEQSASMEEIAASSQSLSRMAEELQVAIGNFKL